jgi:CBS-domain-containing membrane protein
VRFRVGVDVRRICGPNERKRWVRSLYVPLGAGVAVVVPGALAVWTHQLLLFASLGPTAALMIQEPRHPAADWYNAVIGHTLGMLAACVVVWLLALDNTPSIFAQHEISWTRVSAAALSLTLALTLENLAKVKHPPAASTTLLIALGSFRPVWRDCAAIVVGVASVTLGAEIVKRLQPSLRRL